MFTSNYEARIGLLCLEQKLKMKKKIVLESYMFIIKTFL